MRLSISQLLFLPIFFLLLFYPIICAMWFCHTIFVWYHPTLLQYPIVLRISGYFLLYYIFLVSLFAIQALDLKFLGMFYDKRKNSTLSIPLLLIAVGYVRWLLAREIPLVYLFNNFESFRRLRLRSYAKEIHLGSNCEIVPADLQDPDLTYIGNNVVIGSFTSIICHSFQLAQGRQHVYRTAPIIIEDNVTIGGNGVISMGCEIGEGAIIKQGSAVAPFTKIGKREVWGGNPAQFERHLDHVEDIATSIHTNEEVRNSAQDIIQKAFSLTDGQFHRELSSSNFELWDSIGQLSLGMLLQKHLNRKLSIEELLRLNSVASVENIIAQYQLRQNDVEQHDFYENSELFATLDVEKVSDYLSKNSKAFTIKNQTTVNIACTFVCYPIKEYIIQWARAFGIECQVEFCDYGQIEQPLLAKNSIFANNSGFHVIILRLEDLLTPNDDTQTRMQQISEAIADFQNRGGQLIVTNLPPIVSALQNVTHEQQAVFREQWQKYLQQLKVATLDFSHIIENVGITNCRNTDLEILARTPYQDAVYRDLGISLVRHIRKSFIPAKKVIAVDCDNTLWGGIIGEDGIAGIQISDDYPGRCFRLFQERLLHLKNHGVLLVLVSKNEPEDVWEVFEKHSGMVLKRSDIAGHRINWQRKSENLKELADELNLGIDSFVFLDDNPVERSEVATYLPDVVVVPLNAPETYAENLAKLWIFDRPELTQEDKNRTKMVQEEQQRREFLQTQQSIENFLQSLQIQIQFNELSANHMARVVQLIQKTNQFNLSLKRRTTEDLAKLALDSYKIYTLTLQDRFGEYGLVGVAILHFTAEICYIDTFLMSCRALGKGVEKDFWRQVLLTIPEKFQILAPFVEGPRNKLAIQFFQEQGYDTTEEQCFLIRK